MLTNYLKIAFRSLWKNRGYTAINVVGLGVAFCISVFLLLTAYVHLTYDSFHDDGDRIFQTYFAANDPERPTKSATMPMPLAPTLKAEFPELEAVVRVQVGRKTLVEANGKYVDKLINYTDPDFLKLFTFPLISGNQDGVLRELGSVVISENMAHDLFGAANPVGKRLRIGGNGAQRDCIVTGVLADVPDNSTIRFDALVRIEDAPGYASSKTRWEDRLQQVFLKLSPQLSQATLETRLKAFTQKYFQSDIDGLKQKKAQPDAHGDLFAIRLQSLADVHFSRGMSDNKGTPVAVIYVLMGMAFFILSIASINFINLSIARSFTRAREVGVRKSLGALKGNLFLQIWSESGLVCLLGFVLGAALANGLMPAFNAQFGAKLKLESVLQPGFIGMSLAVVALVTLVAGGYPAWQMARFNTIEVLKGNVTAKRPGALRNALIVTQFALSCLLTCCTIIAFQQVGYLRSSPLGFDKEQVISIPVGNQVDGRQVLNRLRNRLANDPTILAVTGTGVNLGRGKDRVSSRSTIGFTHKGKQLSTDGLLIDYDYLKTLNIKLLAGRDFNRAYAADSSRRVIVTQSLARQMGVANPVGTLLGDDADKLQIIGVVPDFRLYSVAEQATPIMMYLSNNEPIHYVFVRVSPQSLASAMEKLQKAWAEVAPQSEFLGSFLDENVDAWYQNEEQLSQVLSLAAGIAIMLSCIGLFAIALLMIEQRTKEIGVRKVLGASIPGLVLLLSRDFVKLVLIALAIAVPLAWFGMDTWLANYARRVAISPWVFMSVGVSALLIALLTVSFHSIKAALMDPVKTLRSE
ncbi:ABC transporter permease [Fibrella sp. WM1]|uniref:ABC transporter permease n=1 Tax=Fibrella musci TaxID=3242485 RepID=UPI0035229719